MKRMKRGVIKITTKRGVIRLEGEFFSNEEIAQLATAIDSDFFDYETIQFEMETGNFSVLERENEATTASVNC
jgi:hypothetical protein